MSDAASTTVPWEHVVTRSWRKLALTVTAALAVASVLWQATHRGVISELVFRPDWISPDSNDARHALFPLAGIAVALAAIRAAFVLRGARRGQLEFPFHRELLVTSFMAFPLFAVPTVEMDHPVFISALVILVALAFAFAVSRELSPTFELPDLTPRQAQVLVGGGFLLFFLVMGFLSYWRFITFHAETCDASWEVGAIAGITRHGYPTVSVAAWLYDGKPLPQPYFNNHVPFVDYLFAPFYAVYPNPRILFWLQAAFMGTGAFGANLIGRKWLGSRAGGALAAWLYLLNPSVQCFCLHDIHANVLIIPSVMLAVGFMEVGRFKTAAAFGVLTTICREEAPLFGVALGLYWMFSGEDRRRFRYGLCLALLAAALEVFFSAFLMPHFGGQPRWEHFNLFFDASRTPASMLGGLVLNPLGSAFASTSEIKLDYLAISLVWIGGLSLFGWKSAWFALPSLLLLVPSGDPAFFCLGMNYSTPLVPAVITMGLAGLRYAWFRPGKATFVGRASVATYVLSAALMANYLYGNIASKSYKFEYGNSPYRRENQRDWRDILGYLDALPPFTATDRALWDVIDHVPRGAPVLTSWVINPQLSDRDVALTFVYSGGTPPPVERVSYVVIDKLPVFQQATEPFLLTFRANPRWRVKYENAAGVIFEKAPR